MTERADAPSAPRARGLATYGAVIGGGLVLWGLFIGLHPLADNSFFTHLATGRLIFAEGLPRSDPYSFTAPGEPWVVQSWLASVVYAAGERLGGLHLLVVLNGALTALLAALLFRLTRAATSIVVRLGVAALAMAVGTAGWSERPLLLGLIFLAVTVIWLDDRRDPRWLVPVLWLWVNVHGSFPLAGVYAVAVLAGARLDRRDTAYERRALGWIIVGTAVGAVNPLGPRLLVFPLQLLARNDVLAHVLEWQAPGFRTLAERIYLLAVVLLVLGFVRRPAYRDAVPALVFVAASLVAFRNMAPAAVVLTPVLARRFGDVGSLRSSSRLPVAPVAAGLLGLVGLLLVVQSYDEPAVALKGYPVGPLAWLELHAPASNRWVAPDYVGNLREVLDPAPREAVFIDDRYDMWPEAVVDDANTLLRGTPGWEDVLASSRADAVVWASDRPLAALIAESRAWRIVYQDDRWIAAVPRPPEP